MELTDAAEKMPGFFENVRIQKKQMQFHFELFIMKFS